MESSTGNEKPRRKGERKFPKKALVFTCLIASVFICIVVISPAVLYSGFLATTWVRCQVIPANNRYQQAVNVSPLMDLEIPADMDLRPWKERDYYGAEALVFLKRYNSRDEANDWFEMMCEQNTLYEPDLSAFTYGDEGDDRYCASYVEERLSSVEEGFCRPLGEYQSYVIIQKNDIVIEVYEDSAKEKTSTIKDDAIQKLAGELKAAGGFEQ